MSEYSEYHNVSKLIGAPPGYEGHGDGGLLTEKVRRTPYCVLLFDELEKAHKDVLNVLLQILDEGTLSDSCGLNVDFSNTLIIMTTNAGSAQSNHVSGFSGEKASAKTGKETLSSVFSPELLDRIDEVVYFSPLDESCLKKIALSHCDEIVKSAKEAGVSLSFDESFIKEICKSCKNSSARQIKRKIRQKSEELLPFDLTEKNAGTNTEAVIVCTDGKATLKTLTRK